MQLNADDFTASKIVLLHHLVLNFDFPIILDHKTLRANAGKLAMPQFSLAGCTRKHGLVTFVNQHLSWIFTGQSPAKYKTESLSVYVAGYNKIINIHKPNPSHLAFPSISRPGFSHLRSLSKSNETGFIILQMVAL